MTKPSKLKSIGDPLELTRHGLLLESGSTRRARSRAQYDLTTEARTPQNGHRKDESRSRLAETPVPIQPSLSHRLVTTADPSHRLFWQISVNPDLDLCSVEGQSTDCDLGWQTVASWPSARGSLYCEDFLRAILAREVSVRSVLAWLSRVGSARQPASFAARSAVDPAGRGRPAASV